MGGVSSAGLRKSFVEKYMIRKKYHTYRLVDHYYLYDRLKYFIPAETSLNISIKKEHKRSANI